MAGSIIPLLRKLGISFEYNIYIITIAMYMHVVLTLSYWGCTKCGQDPLLGYKKGIPIEFYVVTIIVPFLFEE